jgi:hypothetical protein
MQAMNKSFPKWPALFLDFMLPLFTEHFSPNLRIADTHGPTHTLGWPVHEDGALTDFPD